MEAGGWKPPIGGIIAGRGASAGGGVHCGAGGCMPNPKAGAAGAGGGDAGEVTVCPHVGHGPLIPAMWEGTVSWVRHAPHSNWMTSDIIPE